MTRLKILFVFVSLVSAISVSADMVLVPGGALTMGSNHGLPDERPVVERAVVAFRLDKTPVTVAAFRRFVAETGYVTTSEEYGDAAVFDSATGRWALVIGASWQHPFGESGPAAFDDHPVTQVSWHDAQAFCRHYGKRLPTEAEWEHAAKNGRNDSAAYSFGETIFRDGEFLANVWNGRFPVENTIADGFSFTSPVAHFGVTELGLTDMAGNVWEWSADWYLPYSDGQESFQPNSSSEKALRGGSYLCDEDVCHGYRTTSRSHATPDSSLMHAGFRCAADV